MDSRDQSHTLSVAVGASSALSPSGEITLPLNMPLREVHRIYLIATACTGSANQDLRVELLGVPFSVNESPVAGAGAYPPEACYLLVNTAAGGTTVQHYGIGHCWAYKPKNHNQFHLDQLRLRITRWDGSPASYTSLFLQFLYVRAPLHHLAPDSETVLNGMNEFRGAGRF